MSIKSLIAFAGSRRTFWLVLLIAILQGLWYAFSQTPGLFDEPRHLGFIEYYAESWWPFSTVHDTSFSHLGDTSRDPHILFYYLMSIPYRVIGWLNDSTYIQLVGLRLLNIGFAAWALVMYRRLFLESGVSGAVTNLALLIVIRTPMYAVLPGAVNYDNLQFLLAGTFLLFAARVVRSKSINIYHLTILYCLALIGMLVKVEFAAVVVPAIVFIGYHLYRSHQLNRIAKGFRQLHKKMPRVFWGLIGAIVLSTALFIERPVLSMITYSHPKPICNRVIPAAECLKNPTWKRNITNRENRSSDFDGHSIYEYVVLDWIPTMVATHVVIYPQHVQSVLVKASFTAGLFASIVVVSLYIRDILHKDTVLKMLASTAAVFVLILFITNYLSYLGQQKPISINARYLLPIAPVLMVFSVTAWRQFLHYRTAHVLAWLIVLLVLSIQGATPQFM